MITASGTGQPGLPPSALTEFEPANLGTKGQHATPRPPKPLDCVMSCNNNLAMKLWNVPVPGGESFNCFPHTVIATLILA